MNKKKTLLAARKKLKEFQLSKKGQAQDPVLNEQNYHSDETASQNNNAVFDHSNNNSTESVAHIKEGSPESTANSQNTQSSCPDQLTAFSNQNTTYARLEDVPSPRDFFYNTSNITSNKSADELIYNANFTTEQPDTSKYYKHETHHRVEEKLPQANVPTELSDRQENIQPYSEQNHESHTTELPALSQLVTQHRGEPGHGYDSLNDSPSLQKEHLLQMASAVADVLVHDLETKESSSELASDLEQRNQFLASRLQEQQKQMNQLHVQVSQYSSRVAELEAVIATKDAEFEAKFHREVNPLKEQLQLHVQTTGILVGEKAELTAALTQSQATAKQKAAEVEDLSGKLKTLHLRVCELEKELNSIKSSSDNTNKVSQQLQSEYDILSNKYSELRKEKEDVEMETSELRQKVNMQQTELLSLHQELQEKNALVSLNELRMQQMSNSPQGMYNLEDQHHVVTALEQQLAQLMDTLKSVSNERDEASTHYQNYVQQLNDQITSLAQKLEETTKENTEISAREHSLIQGMSELERQLQAEKEKVEPTLPPPPDNSEQVMTLEKTIDELVLERDKLQLAVHERDSDVESLKKEVEELQEMREREGEASRLASALEGERLAAARAVAQNQELKQRLEEMEDAFIQLSNTKLNLTEQLQAERSIGRKLNARLNDSESDMDKLKEELKEKEVILSELEKEKLQTAQITDQMQHYQAQSHHASTIQQELRNALEYIEKLKKDNQQLMNKLNAQFQEQTEQKDAPIPSEVENLSKDQETPQLEKQDEQQSEHEEKDSEAMDNTERITATAQTPTKTEEQGDTITPDAVRKLEDKFKETMERVAELSDEKQRLEHLVLQLQGETETIGEYVTLYQRQRAILKERAKEKEQAFRLLIDQRNEQQEQLHKLKVLVADLIRKKTEEPNAAPIADTTTSNHIGENEDVLDKPEITETANHNHTIVVEDKTTSQILDLLTEIKECKDTCVLEPNFHPCPWCSGKLITV